jgi:diguanylate cyclase (GGDEF)-like protein
MGILNSIGLRGRIRLVLGIAVLVAAVPVPMAFVLRHETNQHIATARASVSGLDRLVYTQSAVSPLRFQAEQYAAESTPKSARRLRANEQATLLNLAKIDAVSKQEAQQIRDVELALAASVKQLLDSVGPDSNAVARSDARRTFDSALSLDVAPVLDELAIQRSEQAARSHEAATRSQSRDLQLMVGLLIVVITILTVFAAWVPYRIARRLELLQRATKSLARGARHQRIRPAGHDEIASLTRDINVLATSLQLRQIENDRLIEEQRDLATRDSLTMLFNNRFFHDSLAKQVLQCSTTGAPLCVAMLDLDDFKRVNDTYGHAEGDAVLLRISRHLREHARAADVVGRLGGEEFGLVLPNTTTADALELLRSVSSSLRSSDSEGRRTTFSCGIAELAGDTPDQLYQRADRASYDAKANGKNRIEIARSLKAM